MTAYRTPWTLSVDGNGVYIHDADRNLIRAIENDEGEDQIALWSRIVDAVNAREAKRATLPLASTAAVGIEDGDALFPAMGRGQEHAMGIADRRCAVQSRKRVAPHPELSQVIPMSRVTDHRFAAGGGADASPADRPAASSLRAASGGTPPNATRCAPRRIGRALKVAAPMRLAAVVFSSHALLGEQGRIACRKAGTGRRDRCARHHVGSQRLFKPLLETDGRARGALQRAGRLHLFRCVPVELRHMPASARPIAIPIAKLSRMSAAERAALDNPHLVEPKRAIVTVPVTSLAASTQAALVALSHHPVAKAVSARLKASTVRYNGEDFATLRALGLAEREPQTIFHRLTDEGRDYARGCAVTIARDLGLHEIWTTETSRNDRTAHCTCGWTAHVYSRHLSNHATFAEKVQRHLAEVTHGMKAEGS